MLPRGFESLPLRQFNIPRRGARVVEGNGLENRQARKGLVGSNPTLSAIKYILALARVYFIEGWLRIHLGSAEQSAQTK